MLKASAQSATEGTAVHAPLATAATSACFFGAAFGVLGWWIALGPSGRIAYLLLLLPLVVGQGLAFPAWRWRTGVRLAVAGVASLVLLYLSVIPVFLVPPLLVVYPGLPFGLAYGWAMHRSWAGAIGGIIGFNLLWIAGLEYALLDSTPTAFSPVPGIASAAAWGAIGGAVLAISLTRPRHHRHGRTSQAVWERR